MKKLLLLLLLVACSPVIAQPKLFSSDWPVWYLLKGMDEQSLLNDFEYRNEDYETCVNWFKAGNLDITFMTLYDFISIQPTKEPTVILGITDYSFGGDKIIVRNTINSGDELQGEKVILPTNTNSLWFLHNFLKSNGLSLDDVDMVDQKETLAARLFNSSTEFSAVVGWNPTIDVAMTSTSYLAASTADYPELVYDLIVAKKSFVDNNPAIVKQFLTNFYTHAQTPATIEKTAISLNVTSEKYTGWLADAYVFKTKKEADSHREKLKVNGQTIVEFLLNQPRNLHNEEAQSRFKPREINLEGLIQFEHN